MESSPVNAFYNKIKESLEEINGINTDIKEIPKDYQVAFIVRTAKMCFQKFAFIVFECLDKSLIDGLEKDSIELINLVTLAFRYNRRSLYVKRTGNFKESTKLISLCEDKIFIDNSPSDNMLISSLLL